MEIIQLEILRQTELNSICPAEPVKVTNCVTSRTRGWMLSERPSRYGRFPVKVSAQD